MTVMDKFSLAGKTALITGGAGLYGRQMVAALAEAGAITYVAGRTLEPLEALAAQHRASGHDVRAVQADQADEPSVLALRDAIVAGSGRIDVLVNNAVIRPMKSWNDDLAAFARSMAVNATGLMSITRAMGDVMATQGGGSIINIGSIQGMIAPDATLYEGLSFHGFVPDYFFHKGGMINFTRFVASYYGAKGVRCNCISPGGYANKQDPRFVERYNARTLLGRLGNDEDIKGAIVYLASEASSYVTGVNLPIDGGYTAK